MRGDDGICGSLFSYIDLDQRIRPDHPLRLIRAIASTALKTLSGEFGKLYSPIGRGSIPPERLMRALLLQAFYSIRSEHQLVERIDTDLLFRWFVGLGIEDAVWDATTFSKNRDRLLDGALAGKFLAAVLSQHRSTGHCWRPGPAPRAFSQKTARADRPIRAAMASATFVASAAATTRMPRPPIPMSGSFARDPAKKRGCVLWAMR